MSPEVEAAVYLDYNATAPLRPSVIEAITAALGNHGNSSSVHRHGRHAAIRLRMARATVAAFVGVAPDQVTFTSGGTEANALALRQAPGAVAASAIEHASILDAGPAHRLPVDGDGSLDLAALDDILRNRRPALVSVMLANNETGVVQPVTAVGTLCRRHGCLIHVDAVQALGKVPLAFDAIGADLLSISAHKIGGPPGVGALIHRAGLAVRPAQRGGGQEMGRRAGTENLPGIVGFAAALEAVDLGQAQRLAVLRDRLEAAVPYAIIAGAAAPRLPNTSCLVLPGVRSEVQLMRLDLDGIMVSAGAACSSGKVGASHVLLAMGVIQDAARQAIRVSLGWASTDADVDRFVQSYSRIAGLATAGRQPT